ncbi:hypothetical protein LOC71_08615 [Rhodopirellula sp. JC740]|uniref:Uncharacterized protein n=1 Tax=Rhodopirellula halodulae TaxID=2894198 RepID=A0ABS8NFJ8_9BACT|nr:hypothetical protein [Rhodopirellula sp. JC740]MCC9642335.1 hypothetical protein [Rhodopirellula sp. JC740]
MNRVQLVSLGLITAGCVWRALWIVACVPDRTDTADQVRKVVTTSIQQDLRVAGWSESQIDAAELSLLVRAAKSPASSDVNPDLSNWNRTSVQRFDPEAEVWIVPGKDGQPGWAGWDDDQNGTVDDRSELGAAWSDDHCVTPLSPDFPAIPRERSRIINRGTFVASDWKTVATANSTDSQSSNLRWRFVYTNSSIERDQAAAE